jgi:hypothetical protein
MADLGEQALGKIAEAGISSQLDAVENLDVSIQTDPLKAISGTVDAVTIKGEGMVMQQDLRIEQMELNTGSISINPLSVAFSKIELTHPTEAETHVVLTEADLNRAFNSDFIQAKLKNLPITVNGQPSMVDTQQVSFRLPEAGKFAFNANLYFHETGETQAVAFTAIPQVADGGQRIALEQIDTAGADVPAELTQALVEQAQVLLDLRNFELEGISLRLHKLDVQLGRLTLQAAATIAQFPDT